LQTQKLSHLQVAPRNDLCGNILAQKYELLSFLGSGGMSDVYKARHKVSGKLVAVKVLHEKQAADPNTVKRLKQEAKAAGALTHQNILGIHDIDVDESGMPFLVMDFIDGQSLADFFKQKGPTDLQHFLRIIQQVVSAFEHAQEKGVVHRDLKPNNIMLIDPEGACEVKIVDFGIAKLLGQDEGTAHRLTQTGETFGSPSYMSPEQCMGMVVDSRSDIYALGVVMYELLTGNVPFTGDSIFDTIHKQVTATPPPLVAPQIAKDNIRSRVELIILKCLAKDAGDRYQSFSELQTDLNKLQQTTGGNIFAGLINAVFFAQAKHSAQAKTKVPLLLCALVVMGCASIGSSAYLVYTGVEVQQAFRTLHAANSARTKWLQAYIDSALMYKAGQNYLKSRDPNELQALETNARHLETMLNSIDSTLEDEPVMRQRYKLMRELMQSAVTDFDSTIHNLPQNIDVVTTLYKYAPHLRDIVSRATSVQKQIFAIQGQEDVSLQMLSDRVVQLQQTLIALSIFTLVLDGSLIAAIVWYFRRKKKTGSASAPPVSTTTKLPSSN
jgi:tRNA A-37 threonylcarbamoyl transferase component Bud32